MSRPRGLSRRWTGWLPAAGALALFALAVTPSACSTTSLTVGHEVSDEGAPPSFTNADAATDDAAPPDSLLTYCPSNKCPEGWTTCPNSRFPCDVNILRDLDNCGACGSACPASEFTDKYSCTNGVCVLECPRLALDCDGLPDNGCETSASSNANCGACGNVCDDPARPCINKSLEFQCGCDPDEQYCNRRCVKRDADDHCGTCGKRCNPNGSDGGTRPNNAYFGCKSGQCDVLKCDPGWDNCDNDIETGCETPVDTDDNCGACGNSCPSGQKCAVGPDHKARCMCPDGQVFCSSGMAGNLETGDCYDVATNPLHCGACYAACTLGDERASSIATCEYGRCATVCKEGFADCNSSALDGCEVDTASDPRNCGGCGIACDAIAGQACVAGRCVVEPCASDAGGELAR